MTTRRKPLADQIRARAEPDAAPEPKEQTGFFIPTGSTLLNLALSDRTDGGWPVGKIVNPVGDSSSGKTFIALTMLAEAARLERCDGHVLIHDDAEAASEFDLPGLFGKHAAERIKAPAYNDDDGEKLCSTTTQEFEARVWSRLKAAKPFVYVLDSLDSVSCDEELARTDESTEALLAGKAKPGGSYRMEKAKHLSEMLRKIKARLQHTDSLLMVLSQTRDNIDPMSFQTKTRAGGRALKFYSAIELWTAVGKKITAKDRMIGIECRVRVSKNNITGKLRDVQFPIYYSYGIDDTASCVDWLVKEGVWEVRGTKIVNTLCDHVSRNALVGQIEESGNVPALRRIVGEAWARIEESLLLKRRAKYE